MKLIGEIRTKNKREEKKRDSWWTIIQHMRFTVQFDIFILLNSNWCNILLVLLLFAGIGRLLNLWKQSKRREECRIALWSINSLCQCLHSARLWLFLPCPIADSLHSDRRWRRDEHEISSIDFFPLDAAAFSRHSLPYQCESSLISPSMHRTILWHCRRERDSIAWKSRSLRRSYNGYLSFLDTHVSIDVSVRWTNKSMLMNGVVVNYAIRWAYAVEDCSLLDLRVACPFYVRRPWLDEWNRMKEYSGNCTMAEDTKCLCQCQVEKISCWTQSLKRRLLETVVAARRIVPVSRCDEGRFERLLDEASSDAFSDGSSSWFVSITITALESFITKETTNRVNSELETSDLECRENALRVTVLVCLSSDDDFT